MALEINDLPKGGIMTARNKSILYTISCLLILAIFIVGGCAKTGPSTDANPVKIGVQGDFTGAIAATYKRLLILQGYMWKR